MESLQFGTGDLAGQQEKSGGALWGILSGPGSDSATGDWDDLEIDDDCSGGFAIGVTAVEGIQDDVEFGGGFACEDADGVKIVVSRSSGRGTCRVNVDSGAGGGRSAWDDNECFKFI